MNQIIWYCTEDASIYPNEKSAREGYLAWVGGEEYFEEEVFNKCYIPMTMEEYWKEVRDMID